MIECGVSWQQIRKALDYRITDVVGCLLTHEHKDHCKAVSDVTLSGIPLMCSKGTAEALGVQNAHTENTCTFGDFKIRAWKGEHDCRELWIFLIQCISDGERLLFATDTALIRQNFSTVKIDYLAIECSYENDYLIEKEEQGAINTNHARRLLDSHFSIKACKNYIRQYINLSRLRAIHLLHLSGSNIRDVKQVVRDFETEFFTHVIVHKDCNG